MPREISFYMDGGARLFVNATNTMDHIVELINTKKTITLIDAKNITLLTDKIMWMEISEVDEVDEPDNPPKRDTFNTELIFVFIVLVIAIAVLWFYSERLK